MMLGNNENRRRSPRLWEKNLLPSKDIENKDTNSSKEQIKTELPRKPLQDITKKRHQQNATSKIEEEEAKITKPLTNEEIKEEDEEEKQDAAAAA